MLGLGLLLAQYFAWVWLKTAILATPGGSVAVAHGSLSVRVDTRFDVSQPAPFGSISGETVVVPDQAVDVTEDVARVLSLEEGTTISELIRGLNTIGATPRDIIAILQALRAAGALQADLEII